MNIYREYKSNQMEKGHESIYGDIKLMNLIETLKIYSQDDIAEYIMKLPAKNQQEIIENISRHQLERDLNVIRSVLESKPGLNSYPISSVDPESCGDLENSKLVSEWRDVGALQIKRSKVAVITLAGGQGTRLNSLLPKGMYDIGLASGKTLYQIQGEKLLRLMYIHGGEVYWYIMTSSKTHYETESFFRKHGYFGIPRHLLRFFKQCDLPCTTAEGKVILEDPFKLSYLPCGNGSLFESMEESGIIKDMTIRGVEDVHVYCVDNALVKVADPVFIGYCRSKQTECGLKVVEKVDPGESVGLVCKKGEKVCIVEYNEFPAEMANVSDETGRLKYRHANIANHYFSLEFLIKICKAQLYTNITYHIAKKSTIQYNIKTKEVGKSPCLKYETFIFDVLEYADKVVLLTVPRSEFSPLKNSDDVGKNCPTTCRKAILDLHSKWLERYDLKCGEVEISPLASYDGEDIPGPGGMSLSRDVTKLLLKRHLKATF